jgi:hypothetical protein
MLCMMSHIIAGMAAIPSEKSPAANSIFATSQFQVSSRSSSFQNRFTKSTMLCNTAESLKQELDRRTTLVRRTWSGALFTQPAQVEMSWTYHACGISEYTARPLNNTNKCLSRTVPRSRRSCLHAYAASWDVSTYARHGKSTVYH